MVVDQPRGVAYVSVPGRNPVYPNSVVVVTPTPTLPKVTATIPVGPDPNVLVLSQDGSRLWVGLDGASAIQEINLESDAPVLGVQYKLPPGANNERDTCAGALQPLNAEASSLVVSLFASGDRVGVVVLDNGIPRGKALYLDVNVLAVDNNANVFGVNGRSTSYDFFVLRSGPDGVSSKTFPKMTTDFSDRLVFSEGRIYSESGDVIDVRDPTAPSRAGKLPSWGGVLPLPAAGQILLLTSAGGDGRATLTMVDATTFRETKSVNVKGVTGYRFPDIDLIGKDTIIFLGIDSFDNSPARLMVARTSLLL